MGGGDGDWGASQWGVGGVGGLRLIGAVPVRDNVVRISFNQPPEFTGVLGPNDASNPARYSITPVAGTLADGSTPRPVTPIVIAFAPVVGAGGSVLDVTVDRPFDGVPARYQIVVTQLVSASSGDVLEPGFSSLLFDGLFRVRVPPARDTAVPSRDLANPQVATQDPLLSGVLLELGSFQVDSTGDYAFDQGIINLKKRILRRVVTSTGRFAHLSEYGVGLADSVKRLSRPRERARIVAQLREQLSREPEVTAVRVNIVEDFGNPGLFRLQLRVAAPKLNQDPIDFDVPFSPTGASS